MRCHFRPTDRVRLGKSVAVLMFGTDDLRERANLVKYCGAIIPGSARVSRVGESVSLSRTFLKIVSARRRNQHARTRALPGVSIARLFDLSGQQPAQIGQAIEVAQDLDVEGLVVVDQRGDATLGAAAGGARVIKRGRSDRSPGNNPVFWIK